MLSNDFEGFGNVNKHKSVNGVFVVKKAKDVSDFIEILDIEVASCIEANIDLPVVHVSQSLLKKLSIPDQCQVMTIAGPVQLKVIK